MLMGLLKLSEACLLPERHSLPSRRGCIYLEEIATQRVSPHRCVHTPHDPGVLIPQLIKDLSSGWLIRWLSW